jgi:hypothetical protein
MKRAASMTLAIAALTACETAPPPRSEPVSVPGHPGIAYLPEQRMEGDLTLGFEISALDRCWFDMTAKASAQFERWAPEASSRGPHYYRVVIIGRSTPPLDPGNSEYGHLGVYPCQVQATRILSVKRRRAR